MSEAVPLTTGPSHHFYGYYGICPWDREQRHHLALETDFHERPPEPDDAATVGLVDGETGRFRPYGTTRAFNFQQGSMMHWIDAGRGEEFTFNDWEDGALVSRAVSPETGAMRMVDGAIAAVSPTASLAIGLNFARMSACRQVVGYASNAYEPESLVRHPEDDGLFLLDLADGSSQLLVSIAEVVAAKPCEQTQSGAAWFNHVLVAPDGERMLFFCRVKRNGSFYSSLWVVEIDGSGLQCQIGYDYKISHFAWLDPETIMISADVLGEMQFVSFHPGRADFTPIGPGVLPADGHNAFCPANGWIACDTYPQGPEKLAELMLYNPRDDRKVTLGRFHSPEPFRGVVRCDLHPRWSADGTKVTFDSVHEGSRQIYVVDVREALEGTGRPSSSSSS